VRQGFLNLNPEKEPNFNLKKNFHLLNYFKKLFIIFSIFFGTFSSKF
jgi:hypothetical protein